MPPRRRLGLCAAVLAGWLWAAGAGAANLQISPVVINFRADQGAAGIHLHNLGEAPIYGQVRVFAWDQQGGAEVLTATRELLASPPIVQIAANGRQTIRLVRGGEAAPAGERTFRVLIDELARDDGPAGSGVDIRLRYSVPVFVAPPADAGKEALSWHFFKKDGDWMLRVRNSGTLHAQIGALSVANRAGKDFPISEGLFGYVLAARMREWRLPVAGDADLSGPLTIRANINAKALVASNAAE
ncbi:molecular chaperone [Janthinobacterium fluminis]|uniref:Fimbria/pilus periplasmic chaperone n=1 Tax=Janthinobacterium fluminis TaxID=2987524 RepID=A0ABT5K5J2_9BURK|nr:fimbria/pilus periplasmic chaperone [Janthinobacterium fluminis]MDC8760189.1 fimbria/pilus periplasmic chaperone [Janthinobacterium fluminis]